MPIAGWPSATIPTPPARSRSVASWRSRPRTSRSSVGGRAPPVVLLASRRHGTPTRREPGHPGRDTAPGPVAEPAGRRRAGRVAAGGRPGDRPGPRAMARRPRRTGPRRAVVPARAEVPAAGRTVDRAAAGDPGAAAGRPSTRRATTRLARSRSSRAGRARAGTAPRAAPTGRSTRRSTRTRGSTAPSTRPGLAERRGAPRVPALPRRSPGRGGLPARRPARRQARPQGPGQRRRPPHPGRRERPDAIPRPRPACSPAC